MNCEYCDCDNTTFHIVCVSGMCDTVLDACDECIHICNDCFIKNKNIVQNRSIQTRSMYRAAAKKQLENSEPPKFDWAKIDADAEAKMAQKKKDDAYTSLWNSGCEKLCYHFGFCSDIMGDCWEPVYDESGLEGLKRVLRNTSNRIHERVCEDCKKWINGLHD